MSFGTDCEAIQELTGASRRGLRALKAADRERITKQPKTRVTHSVDVDTSLKSVCPNDARWDYGVAQWQGQMEHVHWIEVHPASSGANLHEMHAKLAWLKNWLATTSLGTYPRTVVWVASGKSAYNSRSPQIKALVRQGLGFAGSHLTL